MRIESILTSPEGKTLEFKENSKGSRNLLRTVVAFSNTAGGDILLGIRDSDKAVIGVQSPYLEEEKIANLIDDSIHPKIAPNIEIINYRNKYLLRIEVFPGSRKPYHLKNLGEEMGVFYRVGSTNRLADRSMTEEIYRSSQRLAYDQEPMLALNPEAVNFDIASGFFAGHRKLNQQALENLELITISQNKKVPTVGGVILLALLGLP